MYIIQKLASRRILVYYAHGWPGMVQMNFLTSLPMKYPYWQQTSGSEPHGTKPKAVQTHHIEALRPQELFNTICVCVNIGDK